VANIKARGVVARGTLTLDQPPAYSTLCIAPSLDYLERAYDDAKYGKDSTAPYVEVQAYGRTGRGPCAVRAARQS